MLMDKGSRIVVENNPSSKVGELMGVIIMLGTAGNHSSPHEMTYRRNHDELPEKEQWVPRKESQWHRFLV